MASTSLCKYCGSVVSSADKHCPNCGAPNEGYVVNTEKQVFMPKTIEELKEYCAERGMPLLKMRFFIGEDYRRPKAFGIYRDGGDFIVYKNKANGQRAIRYQGPNEAFAVNELFLKLLDECHNRGSIRTAEFRVRRPPVHAGAGGITRPSFLRSSVWWSWRFLPMQWPPILCISTATTDTTAQATERCITTMAPTGTIRRIPAAPGIGTRPMSSPRPTMKPILSAKIGIRTGGSAISRVQAPGMSCRKVILPVPQTMTPGTAGTQTGIRIGKENQRSKRRYAFIAYS